MWLVLILAPLALVVVKLTSLSLFWTRRGVPHEPFVRYLYRMLWLFNTKVIHDVVRADVQKYGKLYGTYRGLRPSLVVADADVAKDVLIKQFGNFFHRTFEFTTGDPLWDNLLTHLPYEQWKSVRTSMGYAFTSLKMRGIIQKLDQVSKRLVVKLEAISRSGKHEFEPRKIIYSYAMDSMAVCSFGIDVNSIENPDNNDFVRYGESLFSPGLFTILFWLCPSLIKYIPLTEFPPRKVTKFFGDIARRILQEKKKTLDEVVKNGTADVLDLQLLGQRDDPQNHITDEVLASQACMFFLAGFDTSATTLSLCIYFLAVNADVQQRVYEQIRSVMGGRTNVEYSDVQKMKLLEASLLESLRIVPIVFAVDRVAKHDTEVAGIPIKKGTVVEFPLPSMQHDPSYFPEPEKFIPERFLKNGDVSSETAAFLGFGDGPRGCIGRRLATVNMQVMLANILLKFRLERCPSTPVPLELATGFRFNNIFRKPLVFALTSRT